jgi:DNA-binding transcriptional MerR regulator/effector-binding domain-containing protein
MNSHSMKMTASQFAKLHQVNKRTLHYYDEIGLFSPRERGENQYRYYDYLQGIDFSYIRMLKELNMSIEEIKSYLDHPGEEAFLQIAGEKLCEIDREIQRLKRIQRILLEKQNQLRLCREYADREILLVECPEETYLISPFLVEEDSPEDLYLKVQEIWDARQMCLGVGSYLSVEKAKAGRFEAYDGLFTPALRKDKTANILRRPAGTYLCGYQKGNWDKLPLLYEKMFSFAEENHLTPTGYAFESGMNDFVISDMEDYITRILIQII